MDIPIYKPFQILNVIYDGYWADYTICFTNGAGHKLSSCPLKMFKPYLVGSNEDEYARMRKEVDMEIEKHERRSKGSSS